MEYNTIREGVDGKLCELSPSLANEVYKEVSVDFIKVKCHSCFDSCLYRSTYLSREWNRELRSNLKTIFKLCDLPFNRSHIL